VVLALLALTLMLDAAPSPLVTPAPVDKVCSRAPSRIAAFNAAAATYDLHQIAAAAHSVVDAYHFCEVDAREAPQFEEPGINYLVARQAQYLVVEGRCYGALGDVSGALRAFRESDKLAEIVAMWQPSSVTLSGRNRDLRPSMYRPAALEIRAAASYEIQKVLTRRQPLRPELVPGESPQLPAVPEPPAPTPSP
jgi:hypothetical protein